MGIVSLIALAHAVRPTKSPSHAVSLDLEIEPSVHPTVRLLPERCRMRLSESTSKSHVLVEYTRTCCRHRTQIEPLLTEHVPVIRAIRRVLHRRYWRAIPSIRSDHQQVIWAFFPRVVRSLSHPLNLTGIVLEVHHVAVFVGAEDVIPVLGEILPYVRDARSVPRAGVGVVRWIYGTANLELFAYSSGRSGRFTRRRGGDVRWR